MPNTTPKERLIVRFIAPFLLILLGVLALHPVLFCDFVNQDDYAFITLNKHVQEGFTAEALKWAFTAELTEEFIEVDYWQPVTVLSRILDVQLFGLNPMGHHFMNLLVHLGNGLLLFAIFFSMTGHIKRSFIVSAVFLIHPLQVEAVAWVTSRKDLLMLFFGLLSMYFYIANHKVRALWRYMLCLIFFAMALMSKPVIVTLPCVFLLLDYWPLKRLKSEGLRRLLVEKIPLFVLVAGACYTATRFRQKTLESMHIEMGFVSLVEYLKKFLFPMNLSPWYPSPIIDQGAAPLMFWQVALSVVIICVITILVVSLRKRFAYLLMGWLWFCGTIFPVVGLRLRDRAMYFPIVGVLIMLVWAFSYLTEKYKPAGRLNSVAVVLMVPLMMVLSYRQVGIWKDTESLFRHALAVTENSYLMEYRLAYILTLEGREDEAMPHFARALELRPDHPETHYELANIYMAKNKLDQAVEHYYKALEKVPRWLNVRIKLSEALEKMGRNRESLGHYAFMARMKSKSSDTQRIINAVRDTLKRQGIDYQKVPLPRV